MKNFVEVFRHQQPFLADMVIETLKRHDIPCYLQQGSITGILLSPVFPAAGPGVEYVVFAAKNRVDEARELIKELPIDKEQMKVPWRISPEPQPKRRRRLWLYWAIVLGLPIILMLLQHLFQIFK